MVLYFMRAPVLGQVWLSPCRLCQALLSAPLLLWLVFGLSSVRIFLFPYPVRVCPFWARCVGVGVFSFFPFFFCVPRLVSRLGSLSFQVHFHLIFIFTSSTLLQQGVCVPHLNRCKTSYRKGVWHSCPTTRNEAVSMGGKGNVAGFLYLQIYLYLYIV